MKTKLVLILVLLIGAVSLQAQVDVDVKGKVTNEADDRANSHVDNAIDKGFNKIEDGVKGLFKKKKNKKGNDDADESNESESNENADNASNNSEDNNEAVADDTPKMDVQWSKFDFVPGDEVIFADGPDIMEENGEFPSRWDLVQGQVEIANVNGENVMMFLDGGEIIPYLKNSNEDYLPDVFTIEFDYYTPKGGNRLSFYLTDRKNNPQNESQEFEVTPTRADSLVEIMLNILTEITDIVKTDAGHIFHLPTQKEN